MKKLFGAAWAAAIVGWGVAASGATVTYNYTAGGLKDGVWTAATYTPTPTPTSGTWGNVFIYANTGTSFSYRDKYIDNPNNRTAGLYRGALVWTAPANEVITKISVAYTGNRGNGSWDPVIYKLAPGEVLGADTVILNNNIDTTQYEPNWKTISFTYNLSDNTQRIGIGFNTPNYAVYDWYMAYSGIVITTTIIPEPASVGLLVLGLLVVLRRRH